jgi:hypothetical protein
MTPNLQEHSHFPHEYYAGQAVAQAGHSQSLCRHEYGSAGAYWWHRGFAAVRGTTEVVAETV